MCASDVWETMIPRRYLLTPRDGTSNPQNTRHSCHQMIDRFLGSSWQPLSSSAISVFGAAPRPPSYCITSGSAHTSLSSRFLGRFSRNILRDMPSSISIPEELHEAIIDELACHTILPPRQDQHQKALINYKSSLETLQACSLVSQSFARRAQGHIYSTLIIRCADSSIVDKKMTKREADKRSNRLNAISDICASKPHIKRSIQSLFIDMTNSGNSPTSLFPPDTQALHDFLSLCDNVTSIYISGRPLTLGRKHTTRPPPVVSLRRLLPKSFRIDQISKCHIWNARLDFGAVGDLVNLSDMSLSSVRFLNYNYPGALSDRQYPLRIRRLYLEHVEDDVLDLLIHNDYGRGPAEHPILDLSTLREFRLGPQRHQYDNRPGYVYTLQQLLEKSLLSLEELELSVLRTSNRFFTVSFHLDNSLECSILWWLDSKRGSSSSPKSLGHIEPSSIEGAGHRLYGGQY